MMFELSDLLWILLLGLAIYLWQAGLRSKERVVLAVRGYCKRWDLQLLDQTVSLSGLSVQRTERGRLGLQRRYSFEFTTTGDERYRGTAVMLCGVLRTIDTEAHRFEQ